MVNNYVTLAISLAIGLMADRALAAPFTNGNLVIYRIGDVGDGSNPDGTADRVFIDEYTTAVGQTGPVQSIVIPITTTGTRRRLTAQGNATFEGLINRTTDENYVLFAGYDAALGMPTPAQTLASDVNRIIGRIDRNGLVNTSTVLTDLDNGNDASPTQSGSPRSVISTNGFDIYAVGDEGGVRLTTFRSTTASTQVSDPAGITNFRHVDIFGGELYASTGVSGPNGVQHVNLTTGALTGLNPIPGGTTSGDALQFFVADLSIVVPGFDTIYVTDNRAQANGGGLRKYSLSGNTGLWDAKGGVFGNQGTGNQPVSTLRGLTGEVDENGTVTLYGVRDSGSTAGAGAGQLLKFVDSSGHDNDMSGLATLLATAPVNTRFTGVDFAPPGVAGDYSGNGVVDAGDYLIWRKSKGITTGATASQGDGNGDGAVNDTDYSFWRERFGNTAGSGSSLGGGSAVPEPTTCGLLALSLSLLAAGGLRSN